MVPGFGSSRGESMMSEVGFHPGSMQEGLTRGTLVSVVIVVNRHMSGCL